jgi:hypothetical protein
MATKPTYKPIQKMNFNFKPISQKKEEQKPIPKVNINTKGLTDKTVDSNLPATNLKSGAYNLTNAGSGGEQQKAADAVKNMGLNAKKPSSGGSGGGSNNKKNSSPTLPSNQVDYSAQVAATQKAVQDSFNQTYGAQTNTGNYKGIDYTITGNAATDALALQKAKNEYDDTKKEKERQDKTQTNSDSGLSQLGLIQQLLDLQKKTQDDIAPKVNDLTALRSRNAQQIANTLASSGDESLQTGRAGIYQQTAAQQEAVRQAEIENILSGANSQASMIGAGETAMAPVQVSPGNSLVTPQTGNELFSGMGGYEKYQNMAYNTKTGQDLGYQATQVANTISQADANFNLLLEKAGINPTQVSGANEIIQRVGNFLGANAAAKQTYDATLNASIGKLLNSVVFSGDESQNILQDAKTKTGTGLTELYLTLKDVAINKYNVIRSQAQQYQSGGTSSVAGGLPAMQNLQGAGTYSPSGAGVSNNDPLGIL